MARSRVFRVLVALTVAIALAGFGGVAVRASADGNGPVLLPFAQSVGQADPQQGYPGQATFTPVPQSHYVNYTDPGVDSRRMVPTLGALRRTYWLWDTAALQWIFTYCVQPSGLNTPSGWKHWSPPGTNEFWPASHDPQYQILTIWPGQPPEAPPQATPNGGGGQETATATPTTPGQATAVPTQPPVQPTPPVITLIRTTPFNSSTNIDWGDRDYWTVVNVNNGTCSMTFVVAPTYNLDLVSMGVMAGTAYVFNGNQNDVVAWARAQAGTNTLVWVGDPPLPGGFVVPSNSCGYTMTVTRYTGTSIVTPGTSWDQSFQFTGRTNFCAPAGQIWYIQSWMVGNAKTVFQVILENGACATANVSLQGAVWVPVGGDRSIVLSRIDQMVSEVIARDAPTTVFKTWLACGNPLSGWLNTTPSGWTSSAPNCSNPSPLPLYGQYYQPQRLNPIQRFGRWISGLFD